jgi:flagellar basal body-associated protein FliL
MEQVKSKRLLVAALVVAIIVLMVALLAVAIMTRSALLEIQKERTFCDKVDILRLPVSFLSQYPTCANELLKAMGIDSVRLAQRAPNKAPFNNTILANRNLYILHCP